MKFFRKKGVQSLLASLICIVLGVLIGYIVLLLINAEGAGKAITTILKNFFVYPGKTRIGYFGTTLVKTAPLLMCSLAVLFAYKTGLFNIGAAGQYCIGVCACLFTALYLGWPWYLCLLSAVLAGAIFGAIVGVLKSYCNVNEVISGIMLNWIALYITNAVLSLVKEPTSPYTFKLQGARGKAALLPTLGPINTFFNDNKYITIAVPIAILIAVAVWVILEKTRFGYELKATGFNRNAAKYAGMADKRNAILTLVIAGALAGLGASFYYQSGIQQWECTATSVPGMGFNGIAATFLGGLNPIGTIFSSYFLQHITDGGTHIDTMKYSAQISELISSVIIYLCGFVLFIKTTMNKVSIRKEAKRIEKAASAPAEDKAKGGEA